MAFDFADYNYYNGPCAIITYAIVFKHYGWYNLSVQGIIVSRYNFLFILIFRGTIKTIGHTAEAILFIYIGINMINLYEDLWDYKWIILLEFGIIAGVRLVILLIITLFFYL